MSICTVCGSETDREVLTATGHDYVMTVIEPTETSDGYIEFSCSRCNESYQSFHISAFAAMESEDGTTLDLDQIAAAGKQWLQENGLEIIADITDEDLSETVSDTVSMTISQETAEALMRRTCFHAVAEAFESSMGLSGLKPVFYCACDGLEESGLAVMNCMYSISAAE